MTQVLIVLKQSMKHYHIIIVLMSFATKMAPEVMGTPSSPYPVSKSKSGIWCSNYFWFWSSACSLYDQRNFAGYGKISDCGPCINKSLFILSFLEGKYFCSNWQICNKYAINKYNKPMFQVKYYRCILWIKGVSYY